MIPKQLRFQAFASYKNEQVIDFEKLGENEIFLIHGKTGSGKTSILDAITYALYGKSSGDGRGELENMRCKNYGVKNIPTEIEFIFEVKGRTYKFFRSVFERTRRTGKTELESECNALFLENGVFVPFFENPTKTKITEKAEEIIGLSYSQFLQVVILPQGKFESFLVAPSKVKEEILVTLFQIENWNEIGGWIYEQGLKIDSDNKLKKAVLESILKQLECESSEQVLLKLSEISKEKEQYELSLGDLEKELSILQKNLEGKLDVKKLFEEKSALNKQLVSLISQQNEIDLKRESLSRSELAQRVAPFYDGFIKLKGELSDRIANVLLSEKLVKEIEEQRLSRLKRLEALSSSESIISQKREKLVVWSGLERHYLQHSEIKFSLIQAENAQKASQQELDFYINREAEMLKAKSEKIAEREEILSKYQVRKVLLDEEISKLDEAKKLGSELSIGLETKEKLVILLTGIQSEINKADSLIKLKKAEQGEKYSLHLSFLASDLSQALSDGQPCRVCGSVHHPNPNNSSKGENFSETLKKISEEISSLETQLSGLLNKKSDCELRIQNGDLYIAERSELLKNLPPFNEFEYNKLKVEYEFCVSKIQNLSKLSSDISILENELSKLSESRNNAIIQTASASKQLAEASAGLAVIEQQLDADIPDITELRRVTKDTRSELEAFNSELESAKSQLQYLEKQLSAENARLELNLHELKKCEDFQKASQGELEKSLEENKFSSIDDFLGSKLSVEEKARLSKACESYLLEKNLCEKALEKLSYQLEGKEEPDVETARLELLTGEEKRQRLISDITLLSEKHQRYSKLSNELEEGQKQLEVKISEAKRLKVFGGELRGDRGIGLRRFVLGVMLESVILEANRLLSGVKGGQFKIFNVTGESKSGQTGLDLMIASNIADSMYSVAALSGGEKFLVAISLSIALSTVVQMQAGGVSIDALFIDEGFGSLDPNALAEAMEILQSMTGSKRFLGIISHVEALKETISNKLEVTNDFDGSRISITST